MKKFLTIKHWQLFGLILGPALVFQFIILTSVISGGEPGLDYFSQMIGLLCYAIFFGWFYTLGINLHKKLPPTVSMNLKRFKLFLLIPAVYILFILLTGGPFSSQHTGEYPDLIVFALIMPVHLFSTFCIFYCLYFNAKALKAVEWQEPVTFSDFAGEFFLIWFFPFGIWIIQPRVNKLFDDI